MKITTKISWSMLTGEVFEHDWHEYDGPIAECKGEGTAANFMSQQLALQQQAYDAQKARLDQLNAAFSPYTEGSGIGYDPALKAALQSQFQNQTASDYGQAKTGISSAILARGGGGQGPMSGSDVQGIMGLEAAKANTLSQGTLGLGISDLQQALQNRFQSGNIMSGNAATLSSPIASFGAGANNALSNYVKAANLGFGATFMQQAGQNAAGLGTAAIGTGLTNWNPGGLFGQGGSCWVARAVYGDHDIRWMVFRSKFFRHDGTPQWAYRTFGKYVAEIVKRSPWLKAKFRTWFDKVIYG